MQVAFYFAGEITQVMDSIPWVRCASGNVLECTRNFAFVIESAKVYWLEKEAIYYITGLIKSFLDDREKNIMV